MIIHKNLKSKKSVYARHVDSINLSYIRLDFLDFEMDGGSAEDQPCDRDSMEIFSAGTSELGMNKICGKNENQHIYIPVESAQVKNLNNN